MKQKRNWVWRVSSKRRSHESSGRKTSISTTLAPEYDGPNEPLSRLLITTSSSLLQVPEAILSSTYGTEITLTPSLSCINSSPPGGLNLRYTLRLLEIFLRRSMRIELSRSLRWPPVRNPSWNAAAYHL